MIDKGYRVIKKEGRYYVLRTKDGRKIISRHSTKHEAQEREAAINAQMARDFLYGKK